MNGKLILFQGDSITDGNRYKDKASEWDLNHQIGHAYPYVIAATLGARHPERGYVFKNRGVSGNQIAQLFGRWKADTLLLRPDVLSVLIGVNDQGETGSDPERYERIYRALLDEALQVNPAMRFVLMEPFILPVGEWAEGWAEKYAKMRRYQAAAARVAGDYGAVFVPLQQKFLALAEAYGAAYWIWDGVHPTEAGHGVIAFEWMERTKDIL
ncbi:MAG: SGNH/GDSL hydrolase family protein [Clostridia bacterium]|nr:SGNH/GDSL hydrolase family protein [Clostridia bacterium]